MPSTKTLLDTKTTTTTTNDNNNNNNKDLSPISMPQTRGTGYFCTLIITFPRRAKRGKKMKPWSRMTYDMVGKADNCLKMYTIYDKDIKFIREAMKNWKVELTAEEKTLQEGKIWTVIQVGDALSSLLFVKALIPLN